MTKAEAQTILGTPLTDPIEAPLGPTCIYKSADAATYILTGPPAMGSW